MPPLYHLCHHHFHLDVVNIIRVSCFRSSLFSQHNDSVLPYSGFMPRLESGKLESPFPFPPPIFPSLYLHTGFGGHGFGSAPIPPVHRPFAEIGSGSDPIHHQPCSSSRCQHCAPKVDSTEQDDQTKEDAEKNSDE